MSSSGTQTIYGSVQMHEGKFSILCYRMLIIHNALEILELLGLHEVMSWEAAFLKVRVGKVCKVFRVCVDACPVDCALCSTARKSRELLFRIKGMFIYFSRVVFFPSGFFYTTLYPCG